jgi:hypothetical protein
MVGLVLIGLYFYSDIVHSTTCNFLVFGGAALLLGVFLWMRSPAPPPKPTGRFRILKERGKKPVNKK